jgi:hypothetical protein
MIPSIITLQKEHVKKDVLKKELYKIILKRCGQRILEANKKSRHTYCFFEIPTILIGHNDYNVTDCAKFLINELIQEHYVVEFIQPNYLYIDWGKSINSKNNIEKQAEKYLKKYPNSKVEIVYDKYK